MRGYWPSILVGDEGSVDLLNNTTMSYLNVFPDDSRSS